MKIKKLGLTDYNLIYNDMLKLSQMADFEEQIWVLEHLPVYTLGKAGKEEHLLSNKKNIPVVRTDRGGQITYHGPGQLIVYPLINFTIRQIGIKHLVLSIENSIIETLSYFGLNSYNIIKKPGVYIDDKKIASIGLRISRNMIYHGLSLNVNMDLEPFNYINPCGYDNLKMTQIVDYLNPCPNIDVVGDVLSEILISKLKVKV